MTRSVPRSRDASSRIMRSVHGKNTRPELIIRQALHRRGLRFRLHRRDLPGCPDIVFARREVAVFVDGDSGMALAGASADTLASPRSSEQTESFGFKRSNEMLSGMSRSLKN